MNKYQLIALIILVICSFVLGFVSCDNQKEKVSITKTNWHIVKTADYVPFYERDWREYYR